MKKLKKDLMELMIQLLKKYYPKLKKYMLHSPQLT